MSKESPQNVLRTLRYSLWDGAAWALTVGFAELYFLAFAVFLGLSDLSLGLVATLPLLLGDCSQLLTQKLVTRLGSRKILILRSVIFQGIALALLALSPWLPFSSFSVLLTACGLYWVAWMSSLPAWQSWMGDLVSPDQRGAYFGKRNQIAQWVTFAAFILGGLILDFFQKKYIGFLILIGLGGLGRTLSFLFIRQQDDLPLPTTEEKPMTFLGFLKTMHQHNFGVFVAYVTLFSLAINISSPYFIPYMFRNLGFSYFQFTLIISTILVSKSLTSAVWGKLSDRYGSRKLFALSCSLFCLPPILWCFSTNFYYLLLIQIIAGVGIAGFDLCSFNFLLDNTEPHERTQSAAYYQALLGTGIVCGALLGGLLHRWISFSSNSYLLIFAISGGLRILLSVAFLPRLREIRTVPSTSYRRLMAQFLFREEM